MGTGERLLREADVIREFFLPLTARDPGAAGLEDDCAVLTPAPDTQYVVTTDSLIEGVHFFAGEVPAFKALAVNVSDLVAKGATPERYLLNIALPGPPDRQMMGRVHAGLAAAQEAFGCHLIGGDTDRTPGPFTLTITAIGAIPSGRTVRRSGAREGDIVAVTGTIGDAGLGLRLRQAPERREALGLTTAEADVLKERFERPRPRLAVAEIVRTFANAAADVSDGLSKDLGHIVSASRCGATVDLAKVPLCDAAQRLSDQGRVSRTDLVASGEDYEVVFTMAPGRWRDMQRMAEDHGVAVSAIGRIVAPAGVVWRDEHGDEITLPTDGWDHF